MAGACLSSSCLTLTCKFNTLSLNNSATLKPLSFSANTSLNLFSKGSVTLSPVQMPLRRSIVCEAAPTKKADSAAKRARQAEKRRLYNKAKKSEVKTRMKTVLEALESLKKKSDAEQEEVISVEKLIAEAYSAIDKAVKAGSLHRNTGARRKSRLARRKKAVEIHHGWGFHFWSRNKMGRIFVVDLEGTSYNCKFCKTQLALADHLVSRAFHCRRGKAYLFSSAVNITFGPLEERMMLSGMHTVADTFCCCCGQIVGWKYEAAHEKNQKYKEGKFVLERGRIVDGVDSEFYIDTRASMSDAEDA